MRAFCVLVLLLALAPFAAGSCHAQASQKAQGFLREQERQKTNENMVVLMSGALGSSYLHLADDIAIAVANGDNMRVVPAIGGGEAANVRDVLLMRGVDLGITTVQMLEALKASASSGRASTSRSPTSRRCRWRRYTCWRDRASSPCRTSKASRSRLGSPAAARPGSGPTC